MSLFKFEKIALFPNKIGLFQALSITPVVNYSYTTNCMARACRVHNTHYWLLAN
jgi:hypothetical protein